MRHARTQPTPTHGAQGVMLGVVTEAVHQGRQRHRADARGARQLRPCQRLGLGQNARYTGPVSLACVSDAVDFARSPIFGSVPDTRRAMLAWWR
jgi:hypothetical protein